jgi:CheY-like chemotaxis protein
VSTPAQEIAHEFNNLLLAIAANAEALARTLDGEQREDAEQIRECAERGRELVGRLLELPAPPVEAARTEAAADGGESMTVLLVDDEPAVRRAVAAMLRRLGHRVVEAADSQSGLDRLHAAGAVDLVLTDLSIGHGGVDELICSLHELRPGTPVLYMSGDAGRAADGPGTDAPFIQKPFGVAELGEKIRECVAGGYARKP